MQCKLIAIAQLCLDSLVVDFHLKNRNLPVEFVDVWEISGLLSLLEED